jgi:hypothetical protein
VKNKRSRTEASKARSRLTYPFNSSTKFGLVINFKTAKCIRLLTRSFAFARDSIPLPHRFRLLCAAKHVERVGGDAGAILRPGMVQAGACHVVRKRGFGEGQCLDRASLSRKRRAQ